MGAGHVFVVRGRLEGLDHDAVVIATDADFRVEGTWAPALGASEADGKSPGWYDRILLARPEGWDSRGWGRGRDADVGLVSSEGKPWSLPEPTWFIDVARRGDSTPESDLAALLSRLTSILKDIAASQLLLKSQRLRPLVAIPALGVRGGGFDPIRGHLIDELLRTCLAAVASQNLDIVVVAFNPADHAAFQFHRRALSAVAPDPIGDTSSASATHQALTSTELVEAQRLARTARDGSLALFFGAGVSMSAGLPSWKRLITALARRAKVTGIAGLDSALDQAELLRMKRGTELGTDVATIVGRHQRYGIAHALLASLECERVVTTNYDNLYEKAVKDRGEARALHVLPYETEPPRVPWLLKMHGDAARPESIVLSRSDFVGYDARSGPMGAVVQALLMTQHLLVVGSSMTDDNFLRLAHEVIAFRSAKHPLGTVLTFTARPATIELWADRFDYLPLAAGETTDGEKARRLAIFLDAVAMYATRPAHLLDVRYKNLVAPAALPVTEMARELAQAIDDVKDEDSAAPWRDLREVLRGLGG